MKGNRWNQEMRWAFDRLRNEEDSYEQFKGVADRMNNPREFILKNLARREGKIAGYKMAFNLGLGKKRYKVA